MRAEGPERQVTMSRKNLSNKQRQAGISHGPRVPRSDSNHLTHDHMRSFSYSTCIVDVLSNGQTIGNNTYYSATSTRHQTKAGASGCDVVVLGVPEGTADLAGWFRHNYPRLVAQDLVHYQTGSIDPMLLADIRKYQAEMGASL